MAQDFTRIKPYGDMPNDGIVQVSFTLPVSAGEQARQAALITAGNMELIEPEVVYMQPLDNDFTYFILYGRTLKTVDYSSILVVKPEYERLEAPEINSRIRKKICRKITVLGACIESDAHTVGIDAIMNMKGYDMHKGLESYTEINAINLGAQVPCEELVALALEKKADALLISQVVTQRNAHVKNLTKLAEILEVEGLREQVVLVVGGPHITPELAKELGYDAGFGPGTFPEDVASYLLYELSRRKGGKQ